MSIITIQSLSKVQNDNASIIYNSAVLNQISTCLVVKCNTLSAKAQSVMVNFDYFDFPLKGRAIYIRKCLRFLKHLLRPSRLAALAQQRLFLHN